MFNKEKGYVHMNASEFGCGQGHELAITWAKAGGELADLTALTQGVGKCKLVIAFLRDEADIAMRIVKKVTVKLLREITKVILPVTTEKKTANSFLGDRYCYRDNDLDNWFAKVQPIGMAGQFTANQLEKEMTFKEVAAAILQISATSGLDFLAKALIENGHTVVLPQIESLIERTDTGENTGLRTDGYANFFFVINKEGSVSVVHVFRRGVRRWRVRVYRFGRDYRWDVGRRFFSRNSS